MKLIADFHTHSKYSRFNHGKDTIEELVHQANELGLKELAITDHGYKNFFGTSLEKMKRARAVIDDINTWSKTRILLGIEADLLNVDGDIDIDEETLELIDILLVGYHKMIKTDFASYFGSQKNTQAAIDRVTTAYINAINKYPITIITHLDSVLKTDLYKIGCACRDRGVMVEINNRHLNWSKEQIDQLIKSDCMFVVDSDAHCRDNVGKVDRAMEFIKKYNVPSQNIANIEFSEDEMTIEDMEDQIYYDVYKQKLAEKEEKRKREAAKSGADIKLSKEMEDALEKLAKEQGDVDYERYDTEINKDDILNSESYQRDVDEQIKQLKSYMDTKNKLENGSLNESDLSDGNVQENGEDIEDRIVQADAENEKTQDDAVSSNENYTKSNVNETISYNNLNDTKNNNFIKNDNVYFGLNNNNQFSQNKNIVEKDNFYENQNAQEQQIEQLKKDNQEKNSIENDFKQSNDSYNEVFENLDEIGDFNLGNGDKSNMNFYGLKSFNNQKTSKTQVSNNVTIQSNITDNNNSSIQKQNTKPKSFNGSGNFFSETGNVLAVMAEDEKLKEENEDNKTSSNIEKPNQLKNGLIDFSSLKDDD